MTERGKKFDNDKPDLSLIPGHVIVELGRVLTMGKAKYKAHNWRGGIEYSRLISAAMRHMASIQDGQDIDDESGLPHAAHIMANMAFLLEFYKTRPDLDDRYKFK
jgi:hypothetical protein